MSVFLFVEAEDSWGKRPALALRIHGVSTHMAKQLLYTDEARKKLLGGAEKLAKAVGVTLGPTGRNVILDKSFGGPTVTKDGVTVSKEIDLPDPFENMGALDKYKKNRK